MDDGRSRSSLQIYAVVFFAIVIVFIAGAGFLQQRSLAAAERYDDLLEEQQVSLDLNTSMLKNIQERYEDLNIRYRILQSENDTAKDDLAKMQSQARNLELLIEIRMLADDRDFEAARTIFATVARRKPLREQDFTTALQLSSQTIRLW